MLVKHWLSRHHSIFGLTYLIDIIFCTNLKHLLLILYSLSSSMFCSIFLFRLLLLENSILVILLFHGDGKFYWALSLSISGYSFIFYKFYVT